MFSKTFTLALLLAVTVDARMSRTGRLDSRTRGGGFFKEELLEPLDSEGL